MKVDRDHVAARLYVMRVLAATEAALDAAHADMSAAVALRTECGRLVDRLAQRRSAWASMLTTMDALDADDIPDDIPF